MTESPLRWKARTRRTRFSSSKISRHCDVELRRRQQLSCLVAELSLSCFWGRRHAGHRLEWASCESGLSVAAKIAEFLCHLSAGVLRQKARPSFSLVSAHSARDGNARFLCSGCCRQWRQQQCEVVPFRCGGSHTSAAEHLKSADAAKTSGSWTNRPDLATQCCSCRAEKRESSTNHSHVWNAGSSEAERKRGTNFDREPGTGECERVTRWLSDAISVLTSVRPSLRTDTVMNSTSALEIYTWCHSGKTAEILKRHNQRQPPEYKLQQHAVEIPRLQQPTHAALPHLHGNQPHSHCE